MAYPQTGRAGKGLFEFL